MDWHLPFPRVSSDELVQYLAEEGALLRLEALRERAAREREEHDARQRELDDARQQAREQLERVRAR